MSQDDAYSISVLIKIATERGQRILKLVERFSVAPNSNAPYRLSHKVKPLQVRIVKLVERSSVAPNSNAQ